MAEGNVYSNLVNLIREEGYNKDIYLRIGQVSSISPLKIQLHGYEIIPEDYILCEHVGNLAKNEIGKVKIGGTDYKVEPANPLQIGDKILVLVDGDNFYVIDRVV